MLLIKMLSFEGFEAHLSFGYLFSNATANYVIIYKTIIQAQNSSEVESTNK